MQKKLPIGISSLEEIVKNNCLYVDKTPFIKLLAEQKYYFLSRPRRFGKTLFLDSIKQAFLGNKTLFKGLYLENNWDWDKSYPVVHISFGTGSFAENHQLLKNRIFNILNNIALENDVELSDELLGGRLNELIVKLNRKYNQQVVVLVDEYDKPILDAIDNPEVAIKNRETLKGFYGAIKDLDASLKFVFVTGVTKFAKAGIFSNLNNLNDITFNESYADICGYTQNDIETVFKDYLMGVDLAELKRWYNGYNFLGSVEQNVYNPFDILLFITNGNKYKNYWFETGTPSFLIKLLQKKRYYLPRIEGMRLTDAALGSFDVENLSIEVLLLQAGYLTIREIKIASSGLMSYILDYPNFEVRQSLNDRVLSSLFGGMDGVLSDAVVAIEDVLLDNKIEQIKTKLQSLFASIPHDWYRNNNIQDYEGYYCSIVYTLFNTMGYNVIPEDKTNLGQIDLTINLSDKILILEFKMLQNGDAKNALEQIKEKKYHEKYLNQNKQIYIIGIVFDGEKRNICEYAWEQL